MQSDGSPYQGWTPEQIAQWQAMQGMTPDQMTQWQAMQGMTPDQMTQWQAVQGMTPDQAAQWQTVQSMTPDQAAQWQAMQGMTPDQAAQWQAMQGMTPDQAAQWQAMQGMTPDQAAQWQAMQSMTPEQIAQWQAQSYVQQAPTSVPKRRKRKRNAAGKRKGGALRWLVLAAVVGAGVWFALTNLQGSKPTTAVIQSGTLGTSYRGDALIVRNETAYDDEGVQTVEYVAEEGSTVYSGDVICYVYSTGYNSKEMTTLQDYRDQIRDYQQTLLDAETAYDQKMSKLETEVVQRGLETRSLVQGARGNLINQENILSSSIKQRQTYFRSKYSSNMRLNRLYDDENTQKQRIESWIKQRAATKESIVSFYTDGFEYALSPNKYDTYSPSQVRAMINGQRPETSTASRGRTNIYRLINKKDNYVVLLLIRDNNWSPINDTSYKLKLEQFSNTIVDARVISSTRASGELLVRLAVVSDVTPVLYMRTCQAEIGDHTDCLLVPEAAIYTQNDQQGVVLLQESRQVFVPVNIMGTNAGLVYLTAIQTGVLSPGQTVQLFR